MRPSPNRESAASARGRQAGGMEWRHGQCADFPAPVWDVRHSSSVVLRGLGHEAWSGRQEEWMVARDRQPCTGAPSVDLADRCWAAWWWGCGCRGACAGSHVTGTPAGPLLASPTFFPGPDFPPTHGQVHRLEAFLTAQHWLVFFFQADLTMGHLCVRAATPNAVRFLFRPRSQGIIVSLHPRGGHCCQATGNWEMV